MHKPDGPKLTIEYWPIERLQPYLGNPRKNDKAVDRMCDSIREYGFTIPVLARSANSEVIDGHLRLKGGVKLGMTEVPVIPCDGWTEAQVKAFRLMVNRSVAWADWDIDLLRVEFASLRELQFELSLTGFETREIDGFTIAPAADENTAPEPAEVFTARPGDVWVCGPHRVMCGDSTNRASVERLLFGRATPFLMVTDPPYGVNYDSDWRLQAGINKAHQTLADGKVSNDNRCDWREAWALFPGAVAYVWHSALHSAEVAVSLESAGFQIRSQIIWAKKSLVIGRGHYHWQHEPCWYAARSSAHWNGDRKQSTLWAIDNMHTTQGNTDDGKTVHSTQKPVECMRRPILNHTSAGDPVYDPFGGSGTTLVAAELTGRQCFTMELDPKYIDVIVNRWQKLTGKEATLEGDGRSFAAITAERFLIQLGAQDELKEEVLEGATT